MELLDHMVNSIFNFLRNCHIVFQWLYHFTFPQCTRVSVHSHSSQHLFWGWLVCLFFEVKLGRGCNNRFEECDAEVWDGS